MLFGSYSHNDPTPATIQAGNTKEEAIAAAPVTSVEVTDPIPFSFKAEAKHPQEDEEFLLCVRCNLATCPGCD